MTPTDAGTDGILDVSAALRRRLPAAAGVALLVPGARDDAGGRARARDPRAAAGAHALRVGARAVLSPQMGRGGIPSRTTCARSRISRRRCRSSPSATCARRRRACRRSATTSASPTTRSITSTARPARPAGRRRSRSAAATGMRSPTRTRGSCGAWACGRATPCSSRRSSASTWARGARSPASSACARRRFRSAPARPG